MNFFFVLEAWVCKRGLALICALHNNIDSVKTFFAVRDESWFCSFCWKKKYSSYVFSLCIRHFHSLLPVTLS
jgi:hypothetical protein